MKRTYGANGYFDFAEFANMGGRFDHDESTLLEMQGWCGCHPGLDEDGLERLVMVHSENMYRAASLMAYGIGLACYEDVASFTTTEPTKSSLRSEEEEDALLVSISLPYMRQCFDIGSGAIPVPHKYDNDLNPLAFKIPTLHMEMPDDGRQVVLKAHIIPGIRLCDTRESVIRREAYKRGEKARLSKLDEYDMAKLQHLKEPFKVLGQLIANLHTRAIYIGVFDGKPEFGPVSYIGQLWQTMVELKDKQLPGICPICGKVIDRRRDSNGGHPKNTCCNSHSDKFSNRRREIREDSTKDANAKSITLTEELELAVRRERWTATGRNERPLRFA